MKGLRKTRPIPLKYDVHAALDSQLPALQRHVANGQQRQPAQIADRHFARHELEDVGEDADADLLALAQADDVDQVLVAAFRQADDHLVHGIAVDEQRHINQRAKHGCVQIGQRRLALASIDHADHLIAELRVRLHLLEQHLPDLAGADQQDAVVADAARLRLPLQLRVDDAANRVDNDRQRRADQDKRTVIMEIARKERQQRHREQHGEAVVECDLEQLVEMRPRAAAAGTCAG
jgi:hypothetical protein